MRSGGSIDPKTEAGWLALRTPVRGAFDRASEVNRVASENERCYVAVSVSFWAKRVVLLNQATPSTECLCKTDGPNYEHKIVTADS